MGPQDTTELGGDAGWAIEWHSLVSVALQRIISQLLCRARQIKPSTTLRFLSYFQLWKSHAQGEGQVRGTPCLLAPSSMAPLQLLSHTST